MRVLPQSVDLGRYAYSFGRLVHQGCNQHVRLMKNLTGL